MVIRTKPIRIFLMVFWGFLIPPFIPRPIAAEHFMAFIQSFEGTPYLYRNAQKSPITQGMGIQMGDLLVTGETDQINLAFNTEEFVIIFPNSKFILKERAKEKKIIEAFVEKGLSWFKIPPQKKEHFKVLTPLVTASIRGTSFSAIVPSPDETHFCVCEGRIQLASKTHEVIASKGEFTTFRKSGIPYKPFSDLQVLQNPPPELMACFTCHQGGYSRDSKY